MAEALFKILSDNLSSLILKELGSLLGVDKELKNLSSTLSTIQAVLQDAEEKQLTDKAIQNWLKKLKNAAYDADDILDECATHASQLQFQRRSSRSLLNKVNTCILTNSHILLRRKIANRLKEVKERIDEIAGERIKFHLLEAAVVAERRFETTRKQQTGSIITQPEVYGRGEDIEMVVECLVKHVADCSDLSVYAVVGMGGLGKTTLAQLVFNDERVCSHFELRIWVCVSDDFDVKRVIKAIVESGSGNCFGLSDMDPLQKCLQEMLKGKRYLLVLDDVWSEDQEKWDMLKYVLACGAKGSSVVVTTRLKKVASVVRTLPIHHLSCLSQEDCWSLFRQRAFGNDSEELPKLVAIGKEIVKKCGGVPLAAKALGSLMRFKSEENEWVHVKESELWNLPQEETSILPALRLSYSSLPLELRQCFAYCAIFPKDTEIDKEQLILLWMANGFVSSRGRLEIEDVGNEIWNELHWRSFFQDAKKDEYGNIVSFKMHDLVHDLAQSVVEDEYYVSVYGMPITFSSRARHVNISTYSRMVDDESKVINNFHLVRTVLGMSISFTVSSLSRFHSSRALVLMRTPPGMKCPSSIGNLKHLRYLDFSTNTEIRLLPDSICRLWNLQTLKLDGCLSLKELPKNMSCLRSLRHLYLDPYAALHRIPPHIGRISCLQTQVDSSLIEGVVVDYLNWKP